MDMTHYSWHLCKPEKSNRGISTLDSLCAFADLQGSFCCRPKAPV